MRVHKSQRIVHQEKRYPGVGLLICLGTGVAFWGSLAYFIFG
jgi:hypothetical protein